MESRHSWSEYWMHWTTIWNRHKAISNSINFVSEKVWSLNQSWEGQWDLVYLKNDPPKTSSSFSHLGIHYFAIMDSKRLDYNSLTQDMLTKILVRYNKTLIDIIISLNYNFKCNNIVRHQCKWDNQHAFRNSN